MQIECILLFNLILYQFYFAVIADVSNRAASLNLTSTWYAPIPTINNLTSITSAADYVRSNWFITKNYLYGPGDISFIQDPIQPSSNTTVLKVYYPMESYAPVGTKNENTGSVGGVEFYSAPNGDTYFNTAFLSYDIAFDPNFEWVKGGKLPGIFGGEPGSGCSGGQQATGSSCFSMRFMWRAYGAGEAYGYIPNSQHGLCENKNIVCNSDYGTSISRGVISFHTNKWTHIEMYIKLNSGTSANGILQAWQDGSLMINEQKIQYRSNDAVGISSLMFSTFFGGGSSDYATPVDTATYFKNIQFSVGNTPEPPATSSASYLTSHCIIIPIIFTVIFQLLLTLI